MDEVSLCGAHTQRGVGRRLAFLPPHTQKSRTGAAWDASCWEQSASCYGAGSIRSRDPRARRAVLCRRGRSPTGLSQALRAAGGHRSNRGRVAPRSPRSEVRPHPVAQPRRHLQACVAHPVPPSAAGSVCSGIGDRSSRPGLSTLNCGGLCAETHNNIFWHLERSQQTPLHGMLPSECSLCVNPSNDLLWRTPMTSAGRQPM